MRSNVRKWTYYSLIITSLLIAVLLGCFIFTSPAQMKAEAASSKQYISELKMSYGDSEADARKALIDNSYTPIKQDLNKGNNRYVWMGYKTTTNPSEAITDVAMMGEKQGYSYTEYEEMLVRESERYAVLANNEMTIIKEFRKQYAAENPFSILAYNDLNNFKEDDSGKLVGDFFLDENLDLDTLTKFVTQISQYTLATFNDVLCIGISENGESNIFNKINALTQAEIVDCKGNNGYYDQASKLYDQALQFKKILTDYEDIKDSLNDEKFVEENKDLASYMFQFTFLYEFLPTINYGDSNLFEIFTKIQLDVNDMYPLVAVMNDAHVEAVSLAGFYPLFNTTNAMTKSEMTDFINNELDAEIKQKPEVISAYFGVDRKMFQGGVAVTDEAMRKMKTTGNTSAMWGNISSEAEIAMAVTMGVGLVTAVAAFVNIVSRGAGGLKFIFKTSRAFKMVVNEMGSYLKILQPKFFVKSCKMITQNLKGGTSFRALDGSVFKVPVGKTAEIGKAAIKQIRFVSAAAVFYVAIAVITIIFTVFTVLEVVNFYNPTYTETPKILLDRNEDKSVYTRYDAVMTYNTIDGREEIGDVNAYKGKKWGALYTTKDPTAGKPLLADAQVFTDKTAMTKKEYKAVHKFGVTTPAAFNEYNFSVKDEIYLYFKQDLSTTFSASVFAEKATPFLIAILGLIVGFGSAALIFNRKKKAKNQAEEKQDDDKSNDGKSGDDKSCDDNKSNDGKSCDGKSGDDKIEDKSLGLEGEQE